MRAAACNADQGVGVKPVLSHPRQQLACHRDEVVFGNGDYSLQGHEMSELTTSISTSAARPPVRRLECGRQASATWAARTGSSSHVTSRAVVPVVRSITTPAAGG